MQNEATPVHPIAVFAVFSIVVAVLAVVAVVDERKGKQWGEKSRISIKVICVLSAFFIV